MAWPIGWAPLRAPSPSEYATWNWTLTSEQALVSNTSDQVIARDWEYDGPGYGWPLGWIEGGELLDVDIRVRVATNLAHHVIKAGWMVGARESAAGQGYSLRWGEATSGNSLYLVHPGGAVVAPFTEIPCDPNKEYWIRFSVSGTHAAGSFVARAKVWEVGLPEPGWQATWLSSDVPTVYAVDQPGYVTVSNGGEGSWVTTLTRSYTFRDVSVNASGRPRPQLEAPVTVRFNESLNGVFADPTIEASFFQMVDLPVGGRYSLGDQLSGADWYSFTIRDRSQSGGLITYTGETLLSRLSRITPRESLIVVAGEDGVPDPLDLRECLRLFLMFYGVPFNPDLPAFFLRAGDQIVAPTVTGFVIQPDQENPESIYSMLERFFGPFRGYTWRADAHDRLVVTQPSWVDTIGLRLVLYTRLVAGALPMRRAVASAPWSTTRRPHVEIIGTVEGTPFHEVVANPLEAGTPVDVTLGPLTVRVEWNSATGVISAYQWPAPGIGQTTPLYSVTVVLRPEVLPADTETLTLTNHDLGPDEFASTSAESVINQAIVPVRERTFLPGQQVMQAGSLVLGSPGGLMPSLFGGNLPFGPMAEDLETPTGFLELVNSKVQEGTWFWPVETGVVTQPGGAISVAFEVEEWAEQWRDTSAPHAPAVNVNNWSDTVELPANGTEVELFRFQFPRQTSNFAPSPYGARGTVWGRWVAGDTPGIQVRVGNSHFVEYGFLWEGIGGQTVYFLWGAIVKLNGTGATFTDGDLHTYRFGFSRSEDGRWEGGAEVPALSESQRLYPDRVFHAPELPYQVAPATGLAIARAIVEENLTPKTVYRIPVEPSGLGGWIVRPDHLGRAARVQAPGIDVTGRVVSIDYPEAHTPLGSSSGVTVEIEVSQPPAGSRAASRTFGRAAYGVSHYEQED